jgi:hypothetical protein
MQILGDYCGLRQICSIALKTGFLDAKILREHRTHATLAKWLREAERMPQLASQQRKAFELIIKKF